MKLVRWNPLLEPFEEMDKIFTDFTPAVFQGFAPAMDIYQNKDSVIVETPLAGIDPEKVNISIENDVLTIEGGVEKKSEVEEKDYYRKEVRSGSFHRAVSLPTAVVGDKARAEYDNGVLKITIPKEERANPKVIRIQAKKKNNKK